MIFLQSECRRWLLSTFLLVGWFQISQTLDASDCIAEKFYRYSKEHTACVPKADGAKTSGVSSEDKKLILDKHNELRALQTATNMQKMAWDDEIAKIAQRWADNCEFEHDKERRIPGRFSVGQNLAAGYSTWDSAIQGWYDEISDFTYGNKDANVFKDVGHYTQMVWADSAKLGCGYTYCTTLGNYKHLYVCNYGPSGNFDWWKPYKSGSKCSDCTGKCSDGLCDCGGKVCENGGTLNLETCECTCDKKWQLPAQDCALNCSAVVVSKNCEPGGFYDGKCSVYSNVPDECPNQCNICPYSDPNYKSDDDIKEKDSSAASLLTDIVFITLSLGVVSIV